MKKIGFLLFLLTFCFACKRDYSKTKHSFQFIPKNTSAIIEINELNDFINNIKDHKILSTICNKDLETASNTLKHFNSKKKLYVAFSKASTNNSDYVILTENTSDVFLKDSITNINYKKLNDSNIYKVEIDSLVFFNRIVGNTFAASNNLELIKNLNYENENIELSKLLQTTESKSVASLIFKPNTEDFSKLLFSKNISNGHTVLDLDYSNNSLAYNGIIISKDSINDNLKIFKQLIPQKTSSIEIAPSDSKSILSITYDDFLTYNKNNYELKNEIIDSTFLNFTNEAALVETINGNAIIIHTLDIDVVTEHINKIPYPEKFRDIDFFEFKTTDFFKKCFQPFITFDNAKYFTVYDNFIVFSDSIDTLKAILTSALNENTIATSEAYKSISKNLSDEASLFIFKNSEGLSKELGIKSSEYNANVVQYIHEENYTHVNGIIKKFKKRGATHSITEAFSTKLNTDILTTPQTLKNHITKAHDIAVQDVNNKLYLISSSGNILWTKQLQGKILGRIEQIDTYKNGRLQLTFSTPNRVYVIDRNGKDVAPFPLKFNDKITQPLSVFDYENSRNYRLLVTQGKHLLMYNGRGKTLKGFNYKNNGNSINSQPKHIRIGNKDYIVFITGEFLKIINRKGKDRIAVKNKIKFSGNDIFLYKNKFTTSNTLGQLVLVDTKGKTSTQNLNLTENHHIETTSKTLVAMSENKLRIKSKTIDLDYGDYTKPRIFYINDKIYVTVTDLQAKKVYLFDSQANPIPNFPVFGISGAELQELDRDRGLELITKSDNKTLLVYKIY